MLIALVFFISDFFKDLFRSNDFMPHGHCYFWQQDVLWTNVIGDGLTVFAYVCIPILLIYVILKRADIKFSILVVLFALFILFCGITHAIGIVTIWNPVYRLEGLMKILTGIISVSTSIGLLYIMPTLLKVPSISAYDEANNQLKEEIEQHKKTELQLKEHQRQLNEAQYLSAMGSWEWDAKTDTLTCSDGAYALLDLPTNAPLTFETLHDFIHPEDKERTMAATRKSLDDKIPFDQHYRVITAKNRVKYIRGRRTVYFDANGNVTKMSAISQDVTDILNREQELQNKTEQLERTVDHLKRFAYATSHDLKEPVRGIIGYSQMIQINHRAEISDNVNKRLDAIASEGKRLISMIESVIDFSKSEIVKKELAEVDMNAIMQEVMGILRFTIDKKNATIIYDSLPIVHADREQMVILMHNLLSNALKFNNSKIPEVKITTIDSNKEWKFIVEDNGIGFDEKYGGKIFEMFQRLHSRTAYKGSGIGLAICKNIVEGHGGRIWVESAPGKGSRFNFTLKRV